MKTVSDIELLSMKALNLENNVMAMEEWPWIESNLNDLLPYHLYNKNDIKNENQTLRFVGFSNLVFFHFKNT